MVIKWVKVLKNNSFNDCFYGLQLFGDGRGTWFKESDEHIKLYDPAFYGIFGVHAN